MKSDNRAFSDPYGLVGSVADLRRIVTFGDVEVSHAAREVNVRGAVGDMMTARVELDARSPIVARVDFTAEVVIATGDRDRGRLFTGFVADAAVDGDLIKVSCSAQPSMHEPLPTEMVSLAGPFDDLYALMREAGLPTARIRIGPLDQLPKELFEVLAPVTGIRVIERTILGRVALLPVRAVDPLVERFGDHSLAHELLGSQGCALAHVVDQRLYEAERQGLHLIDAAIAWVNVEPRFANAVQPGGTTASWDRTRLRQRAGREPLVAVRGLMTGRSWIRRFSPPAGLDIGVISRDNAVVSAVLESSSGLREAAQAAARAITSTDPLTRVTSISDFLEFYAGSTAVTYGFTKAERRALTKVASSFDVQKRERVNLLISGLNQAPLLTRVRAQLSADAVPVTEGDMAMLKRVRDQRNDIVHGRATGADEQDLERAVALLARILSYAAAADIRRRRDSDPNPE